MYHPHHLAVSVHWSRLQERNGDFQVAEDSGGVPQNDSEEQEGEIQQHENQALGIKDTVCPNLKIRENPNPSMECLIFPPCSCPTARLCKGRLGKTTGTHSKGAGDGACGFPEGRPDPARV